MQPAGLMGTCYVILNRRLPVEDQHFPRGDSVRLSQKGIKGLYHSVIVQLSMAQRLRKNHDFLKLLTKCTPAQRKAILKVADDALVRTICKVRSQRA